MPFNIVRGNIASVAADAIVYADTPHPFTLFKFNPVLQFGKGKEFLKTRQEIGSISNGDAKIVPASQLDAKYIIHTSAPVWHNGLYHEKALLASCYEKSLQLAKEYQCESIALPVIASDNMGYPKKLSEQIAFACIRDFLYSNDMMIYLLMPEKAVFHQTFKPYGDVNKYIKTHYVENGEMKRESDTTAVISDDTFQDFSKILSQWMDKKEMKQQDVCHKANMSAKLFSEILDGKANTLNKNQVLALAISLELNLDEAKELLKTAGYWLLCSSKSDLIVEYYITQGKYDIVEINQMLFRFEQALLGC